MPRLLTIVTCLLLTASFAPGQQQQTEAEQVAAAAQQAIGAMYGGRAYEFAQRIDAVSREKYLERLNDEARMLIKKVSEMPETAEMAKILQAHQELLIKPDLAHVKIDGDQASLPLNFDYDQLAPWMIMAKASNEFVQIAALSVKNDLPRQSPQLVIRRYSAESHPYRKLAKQRAEVMREKGITPVPAVIHMVREDGQWKLDAEKFQEDMKQQAGR
ncbi:hypothetical protein HED60_08135 [Planctomycetales bacterium ZRK34]|nr:hypothetical protein HED60_08135 [Planctomycetales bacterium ZRK34]